MAFRTLATARHHGMELTDLEFTVPLDHGNPKGETLAIFALMSWIERLISWRTDLGDSTTQA